MIRIIPYLLVVLLASSCGPGAHDPVRKTLSPDDQLLYDKYLIQGKEIYQSSCQNCHMGNGKGLRKLIPPLNQADYLMGNQQTIPCLIKFGTKESIEVNGIVYDPVMPAHRDLSALEIAEVMTYINNSWDNELGFVRAHQVEAWLNSCN